MSEHRMYCTATWGVHGCTKAPGHEGPHRCGDDEAEWAYYEIPALIAEVRRLRAERAAMLGASAEAMRWTCQVAGHPRQAPTDSRCICATWATHVDRGAVEIECGNEGGEDG